MKINWKQEVFLIVLIWVLLATIYFLFPAIPDWDWLNYKAFNCFSFLTHRGFDIDFFPGNMRTCITPVVDILTFWTIFKLQNHPYLFAFLSLWDSVLVVFMIYKFADYIFDKFDKNSPKTKAIAVCSSIFCFLFMPAMILQLTFEQNDIKIALITLVGFYIFIRNIFKENTNHRKIMFLLCGIVFGVATGLKLTAYSAAVAIPIITLILFKKIDKPINALLWYFAGAAITFSILDGYWIIKVYQKFLNPFFPFFNNVFKSPYTYPIKLLDIDCGYYLIPKNLYEFLFYPFVLRGYAYDNFATDYRSIIIYFVTIILTVTSFFNFKKDNFNITKTFRNTISYGNLFVMIMLFAIPCSINLAVSACARFVIASTVLSGILVTIFVFSFFYSEKSKFKDIFVIIAVMAMIFLLYFNINYGEIPSMKTNLFEKIQSGEKFKIFERTDMNFDDNSVVLITNCGVSATLVNQNPNVQFVMLFYPKSIFNKHYKEIEKIDRTIDTYTFFSEYAEKYCKDLIRSDKNIYLVSIDECYSDMVNEVLDFYNKNNGRKVTDCKEIDLRIFGEKLPRYKYCKFNR